MCLVGLEGRLKSDVQSDWNICTVWRVLGEVRSPRWRVIVMIVPLHLLGVWTGGLQDGLEQVKHGQFKVFA